MADYRKHLRVHGDNILECERAMRLLVEALKGEASWIEGSPFCPEYKVATSSGAYHVRLFPGYGRWSFNIKEHLRSIGALLREATDAVITELTFDADGNPEEERVLLAVEFCGALPAGNNAWQRCGRAVAAASAGIPYLYFAELGGLELDARRAVKAPRLPNPLVPFGYLNLGLRTETPILPCFTASPSITPALRELYGACFSEADAVEFIGRLLSGGDLKPSQGVIEGKGKRALEILSGARKKRDSLPGGEWVRLLEADTSAEVVELLLQYGFPWAKGTSIKTTATFAGISGGAVQCGAVAAGSSVMPVCILPAAGRPAFASLLQGTYGTRLSEDFIAWVGSRAAPLALVWVAGFKPGGDDSRPDRGLVPLARMALGFEIDLLSVVYGPAKPEAWTILGSRPDALIESNGLWEAILCLGDAILVDSLSETGQLSSIGIVCSGLRRQRRLRVAAKLASTTPVFGEHDVDTVLHNFFTSAGATDFMEGMCNPPNGDWSGMSYFDIPAQVEYRWTSLPRVSGADSKRPDHIVLLRHPATSRHVVLITESKDRARTVEVNIGPRLIKYVRDLYAVGPNICRKTDAQGSLWEHSAATLDFTEAVYLSACAFRHEPRADMRAVAKRANTDVTIAVEFNSEEETVMLHILLGQALDRLAHLLRKAAERFGGRVEVKIYGLDDAVE